MWYEKKKEKKEILFEIFCYFLKISAVEINLIREEFKERL